jgi:voltage-gated sodium channel
MISENCTDDQVKWIMMQKLIFSANSNFELIEKPKNKIRAFFFMVVNSRRFEFVIYISIFLNAIVLSMDYEGMSTDYEIVLIIINDVLIWIFVLEFIFKMIAFSWYYFKDPWNLLDFLIALISVAEFFLTGIGLTPRDHNTTIGKISKAARVIRVVRLFKILKTKHLRAFNKLINTLIFSLPTIANVLALLMMVYFIFAVIGCFVFKNAEVNKEYNNQVLNFNTFHIGLLTLFVCSTGEDWPVVMYNYGDSKGMYIVARVYFMTYILVTTFSMLNLLELVVVQIFESFYFDPDNVLETFDQISTEFNKTWNAFTISTKGKRIKSIQLPRLFAHLKEPLGFRVAEENDPDIEQIISEERQIAIRKPLFSIAILIALNTLPM